MKKGRPTRITPQFHCTICVYPVSKMRQWLACPIHREYIDEAEMAKEELQTPIGKRIIAWFRKGLKI